MSWQNSEIVSLNLIFIAEMKLFNQQKGTHSTCTLEENFTAEIGERQRTGRKPQKMGLLPLFVTTLQAEKCCHILLLVYKCTLIVSNLILPYFSPGFILQFCHFMFRLIACFCSPQYPTRSLPVHHNNFILPRFVQSVISFKNMNNHGYFFLF